MVQQNPELGAQLMDAGSGVPEQVREMATKINAVARARLAEAEDHEEVKARLARKLVKKKLKLQRRR